MKKFFLRMKNKAKELKSCISGFGCPVVSQVWDAEYLNKKWDCLSGIDELAHYSVIAGYIDYLKPGGSILDIGCGSGILQKRLKSYFYNKYVGIDVSIEAINKAAQNKDDKTFFIIADGNDYIPAGLFDVIVFNESLYYFYGPLAVLNRYDRYLKPGGIYIISMYATFRTLKIWQKIRKVYKVIDETRITNKAGISYTCRILSHG